MQHGRWRCRWFGVLLGIVGGSLVAQAHHSFTGVFDLTKPVSLQGTVIKFDFINPHGWVTMDVVAANGATQRWRIEVPNPNLLLRMGWRKDSLKPGDKVSVKAFAAHAADYTALGNDFTFADGRTVLNMNVPAHQVPPPSNP
jgi:hypothetical protein